MNLFFRLAHKLFLERPFSWKIQRLEQIFLPPLIYFSRIVQHRYSLLALEGEVFLDRFGHVERGEYALVTLPIQYHIMMRILRVFLVRDGQVTLFPELRVRLDHTGLAICYHWVAETGHVNAIPGAEED